ncbi:MAG: hypothetical protein HYU66_29700 [Armatimonadetes bacterium]|nr:hypothetical protein [Armatimonadota bacterium]
MPKLLPLSLFLSGACLAAPARPVPKVAVLYSDYGNFRHRDDYDARLADLGWPAEKVENRQLASFAPRLGEFDILLGTALYNLGSPQDLGPQRDALVGFMERGGAVVLTDVNYAEHVRFLASLGEGYEASVEGCRHADTPADVAQPDHPLLTWPNRWQPRAMWTHTRTGPKWQVLAKCADGASVWAVAHFGKGFCWLSSFWPLDAAQLTNVWDYLRLRRAGVESFSAEGWDSLTPEVCHARFVLRPATAQPVRLTWCVEQPDQTVVRAREELKGEAGGALSAGLDLVLGRRGLHRTWIELGDPAKPDYLSAVHEVRLPELMEATLLAPAYRETLPLGLPQSGAKVRFTAYPYGVDLRRVQVSLELRQGGKSVARKAVDGPVRQEESVTVSLPAAGLGAGPCELVAEAKRNNALVAAQTWMLQALAARRPQVVMGGNLETCVDGKPFFPIGVYHVPDTALAKAKALGFNCFQGWGNSVAQARAQLTAGAKAGLKVILEMSPFLRDSYKRDALLAVVRALKDHPALLAWYTVDEPAGQQHAWCLDAYRLCRAEDPHHPVYLVMCDPSQFGRYAPTTDILAIDPYPIAHQPIRMVAAWTQAAQRAVAGRQPVWVIPQLQNLTAYTDPTKGRGPTPAEEWCMVAQALIYGAKGIVYYPWDDGPNGLVHEPALLAEMPKLNRLLARVGPGLAASERTLLTDADTPELHAAMFVGGQRLLVATNTGDQPATLTLQGRGALTSLRGDGKAWAYRGGSLTLPLAPLEVVVASVKGG